MKTQYDYARQAWIVNGIVAECGHHGNKQAGCYACAHAGERVADGAGIDQDALAYNAAGEVTGYRRRMQDDLACFCNGWAANIKKQQKISV